jgi:hypothetical protein
MVLFHPFNSKKSKGWGTDLSLINPWSPTQLVPLAIISLMTTVDILFRCAAPPTETQALALANARDVYGIRRISFDHGAQTVRVEYDATRLNAATVTHLVRRAGVQIREELPLIPPPPAPEPAPAA